MKRTFQKRYVLCIQNRGYEASLEVCKVYPVLPDNKAALHEMVRVIDESGEAYLYPSRFFVSVSVPEKVRKIFPKPVKPYPIVSAG